MDNEQKSAEIIEIQKKINTAIEKERPNFELPLTDDNSFTEDEIYKAMQSQQDGDAWLFTQIYKDQLCYDHAACKWYEWRGHYWAEDKIKEIFPKINAVIDIYAKQSLKWAWRAQTEAKKGNTQDSEKAQKKQKDFLKKISILQKENWKKDILELAAAGKRSLGIVGEEWDLDPWLLGCINGVIDLKTGTFRDGKQSEYIKTACSAEWKGINRPCPKWEKFLSDIFDNNSALILFLQRLFGYSITGNTRDHILPIFWGHGRNGKGTIFSALRFILSPLAEPIKSEMLLDQGRIRPSNAPDPDIMALRGRRIAWGSETDEGRKLNIGKVKWLVGGDTLRGRDTYGKREVSFEPTHTLFLLTNHKPKVDPDDYALWQRIYLIPFNFSFIDEPQKANEKKRDPDLSEKLKAEAAGILAWLVRGCLEWQKQGLNPPNEVKTATSKYQQDEDDIGQFINECCYLSSEAKVKAGILYDDYDNWCKIMGIKSITRKKFWQYIKDRFDATPRTMTGIYYLGIGLIEDKNEL